MKRFLKRTLFMPAFIVILHLEALHWWFTSTHVRWGKLNKYINKVGDWMDK